MSPQIGVQLYSVREQLAQDFFGTMKQIAAMGFTGVETAFFGDNITPKEAKTLFDDLGLTVIAAHCPMPLGEAQKTTLSLLADLECSQAIWHGWPEDYRYLSLDGIRDLAALYTEANAVCRTHGLTFGLHNHWWEFQQVEGKPAFEHLRPLLLPEIFFELDTYWIQTASINPTEIIAELGSRAPLLHLKDGTATHDGIMVPIGSGSMDTPAIVRAAERHSTEWLIVELDAVEGDMLAALEQSYRYLATLTGYFQCPENPVVPSSVD